MPYTYHAFFVTILQLSCHLITASPANPLKYYATRTFPVLGNLYATTDLNGYYPNGSTSELTQTSTPFQFTLSLGQSKENDIFNYPVDLLDNVNPQPIRGALGGTDPGPRNSAYDRQNPDTFIPPSTDEGEVQQAKWPMGLSHNRLEEGGWARQQNIAVLPAAKEMAGVDMRLEPNAYRELHWHSVNEWAYVLNGSARISAIDTNGRNFVDDVQAGDLWYFPSGLPHSIQALEDGVEFLLVFDNGSFSEDRTFLITEWFSHTPREVLSKNFDVPVSAFKDTPEHQLYIFPGTPAPADIAENNVTSPYGIIPEQQAFSYHFSKQKPLEVPGGSVKIVDSSTFKAAANIAAAEVKIKPGGMRELHWHPNSDEWNFFLSGRGRITIYDAPSSARTFDYASGDVGYIINNQGHYIENIGDEDLHLLEILKAPRFEDVSLGQWMALMPPQIIKDTLHLSDETLSVLSKEKQYVVSGASGQDGGDAPLQGEAGPEGIIIR
ncbi:hypothetical protein RUND412_004979 [Rhizina undulata]